MPQPLRDYQARAIANARAAYRAGKRAIVLVCPTGGGKTRIGVEIVSSAIARPGADGALWLAHREELLKQAADRLLAEGVPSVGIVAPWAPRTAAPVQVASVQTLVAARARGQELPRARIVILDEAHHYAADTWGDVAAAYRDSTLLGLTATPERGDGRPLGDLFDCLIPVATIAELAALGVLVPCVTYRPDRPTRPLSAQPAQWYAEHTPGERAFVFCAGVGHAEQTAAAFRELGIPAATIHADTPWQLRRARLNAFRTQSPDALIRAHVDEPAPLALCNVYTLTEGVDVPEASVCILARGVGHPGMLLQMVGRVLRAAPGKALAYLADLRGATHKHGLPEVERIYSLDGEAIVADPACGACTHRKSEHATAAPRPCLVTELGHVTARIRCMCPGFAAAESVIQCRACGGVFSAWRVVAEGSGAGTRVCPGCGEPAPIVEPPRVVARELELAGMAAPEVAKRRALESLASTCVAQGYHWRWVMHRYRDRFAEEPDRGAVGKALDVARALAQGAA